MLGKITYLLFFTPCLLIFACYGKPSALRQTEKIPVSTGSLVNVNNGDLIKVEYWVKSNTGGPFHVFLSKDEVAYGYYKVVYGGSEHWGQIFSSVDSNSNHSGSSSVFGTTRNRQANGTAISKSEKGTVVDCEFILDSFKGGGYGACKDNKGNTYRLLF
ncbi:MAG: hypothetical protein LHV69_00240 [Elusimicrobia bacterium]|nr:hypothetical protein [Candidatus Obscuribacterium magneticum]MCB4755459.1 hypothetical protein [Candidatus Obscuribacterium magneticum]